MNGASPESLWDPNFVDSLASESSVESADIFVTAMKNNFTVGHVVVDAILTGELYANFFEPERVSLGLFLSPQKQKTPARASL